MREKTECGLYSPSSIFHFPEVHWSLPIKTATMGFCSIWRAIGQVFIYCPKKLGCMTPNKLAQKQTEDLIINSCTTAV